MLARGENSVNDSLHTASTEIDRQADWRYSADAALAFICAQWGEIIILFVRVQV